jgi:acetolactate synthase-1/2/3 large subunit
VLLTLPMDVTTATIAAPHLSGTVALETAVPDAAIDELIALLAGATRPLILAGSGVRGGDAPARLLEVVERLRCPVACTPKGKGIVPESHPLTLGVLGLGGHPSARSYLDGGVDVLLAIGTSLGDLSTDGFARELQASRAMIHVDIDARQIGKSYAPTHAVVGDAERVLGQMAALIPDGIDLSRRAPVAGVARHRIRAGSSTTAIAPQDAIAELRAILPDDAIVTVDSGEHFLWAVHCLEINHPDAFVAMTGLGSMGQSIGAAIGAQLAHPSRTVATIVGDGCFAMNAFEVATAVAEQLPLRIFVFNDERLGMVEIGHQTVYGRKPDYPTTPLDVCQVARGLGAVTLRVTQPGQLGAAIELLHTHPGPVVVDVRIDPEVRLPKKDRVGAFAPKPAGDGGSRVVN